MRAIAVAAAILLAASCTEGSQPSASTASASRQSVTHSGSPIPDLALSSLKISCRLPVVIRSLGGSAAYSGGFISFPAATFKSDPTGTFQGGRSPLELATATTPVLYGSPQGWPIYDRAIQRWVPANASATTPDGAFYAYVLVDDFVSGTTHLHVVDVAQATERVFTVPTPVLPYNGAPVGIDIGAFDGSDVYFSYPVMEAYPQKVRRLNVLTGTVTSVSESSGVMAINSGSAWVGRVDPRDPSPPVINRGGEFFDSIWRIDLATGTETLWYYAPGEVVVVRGFDDAGRPVIGPDPTLSNTSRTFRLIRTPGEVGTTIYMGPTLVLSQPSADVGRLWFGSWRGIYLWTPTAGLHKVFDFNASHQPDSAMYPAGPCV